MKMNHEATKNTTNEIKEKVKCRHFPICRIFSILRILRVFVVKILYHRLKAETYGFPSSLIANFSKLPSLGKSITEMIQPYRLVWKHCASGGWRPQSR